MVLSDKIYSVLNTFRLVEHSVTDIVANQYVFSLTVSLLVEELKYQVHGGVTRTSHWSGANL